MDKKMIWVIVAVVIVLVGGGTVLAMNHKNNTNNSSNTTGNMHMSGTNSNDSSSSTTPATTNSVTIENFAFSPASITVKKGTAVTWTNKDSATHTVAETDGQSGPNSGDLATGKSYSFTFNTVGTFKYDCGIHPSMTGTVTVTN